MTNTTKTRSLGDGPARSSGPIASPKRSRNALLLERSRQMKLVQNMVLLTVLALAAPVTAAADSRQPPSPNASCVAWFTSTLGQAGVAGPVVSNGAQTLS